MEEWWAQRDLNPRPSDYESPALTTELWAHHTENKPLTDAPKNSFDNLILQSDTLNVKTRENQTTADTDNKTDWVKTPVANLVRYKPSGIYFARCRIKGKLFRQTLKTDVITTAKLRLADFIKDRREEMGDDSAVRTGKMTFTDAMKVYRQRLDSQQNITEGAKVYRRKCIDALIASWPELESMPIGKLSKDACLQWAEKFSADYSPTVYNNTVGTLRMIIDVAIEKGARANNPAKFIGKRRIVQRELVLPSPEQFEAFVETVDTAGGGFSHPCANLIRFLAYGGFRKTEAANITFADCDFANGLIRVRVTKNGKPRSVPMISEMKQLIEKLTKPETKPEDSVMEVRECQKAMDSAAKKIGMKRITHHDLRHLFATRCIETGVDIPTVSRWLGHQDGGALAMKVYGHLRDHHSAAMAQRVSFSTKPTDNVVQLPKQEVAI
jgi:integrase